MSKREWWIETHELLKDKRVNNVRPWPQVYESKLENTVHVIEFSEHDHETTVLRSELQAYKTECERLAEALEEAKTHFDSIQSGLTTDINRVEQATKQLAHEAWIEAYEALTGHAEFMRSRGTDET